MWLGLLLTGCVLPMEESLARVAFCQSCDLGHVDFLLYCPVIGLKESVSETRIVFKNCCSKVYFLQKPVPHFAYFHRRIIHLVCFSPLCLIWEKKYSVSYGFRFKSEMTIIIISCHMYVFIVFIITY